MYILIITTLLNSATLFQVFRMIITIFFINNKKLTIIMCSKYIQL